MLRQSSSLPSPGLLHATCQGTPYEFRIAHNAKITIDGRPATVVDLTTHPNATASAEFVPTTTGNFVYSIELNSK